MIVHRSRGNHSVHHLRDTGRGLFHNNLAGSRLLPFRRVKVGLDLGLRVGFLSLDLGAAKIADHTAFPADKVEVVITATIHAVLETDKAVNVQLTLETAITGLVKESEKEERKEMC